MNNYIVSVYIKGKTVLVDVTLHVKAKDKDAACRKAKKIVEDEGFVYGGLDYCDWAD